MANFQINPGAEYVSLRIKCPTCGREFVSDAMPVPSPNWEAETHCDSIMYDMDEIQCEHCGECFDVSLYNGFYGGEGEINLDDEASIIEVIEEFPDDFDYDKELFEVSHADIADIIEAIDSLSEPIKEKLYKLLYVQIIINLETYLGDTLKHYVLNHDEYMRKFVEGYTPYQKENYKFSDIYRNYEKIKDIVKNTLNELLYHKLYLMKTLYKAILNVDVGDIGELTRAVKKRHDIVHRNGKDLEGVINPITKDDVMNLYNQTQAFINNIDIQLPSEMATIDIDELLK